MSEKSEKQIDDKKRESEKILKDLLDAMNENNELKVQHIKSQQKETKEKFKKLRIINPF